ncbi:YggS family pyridoxal phosphate-dependent enzyme [Desulfovibrionales bacterium]
MDTQFVVAQWQAVLHDMAQAAQASGRSPQDVRLVAVSKFHSAAAIHALYTAGQCIFGESYAQEARVKMTELPADISWHFIGHVQRNKVRHIVGKFALVHSIDSLELAHIVHKRAMTQNTVQDVLVQVNLAQEPQKSGIAVAELGPLAEFLAGSAWIRWQGLMLMPPFFDDPEQSRPYFARLRVLRDRVERDFGVALPELSMGMTGDFEAAIAEGATLVRIGTRIFGARCTLA